MRCIPMKNIDSSLAFGFYVRDEDDFQELYAHLKEGERGDNNWFLGIQNIYTDLSFEENDERDNVLFDADNYHINHNYMPE